MADDTIVNYNDPIIGLRVKDGIAYT